MKPRVYIETTILSYLTARPASNVVASARQQITKRWWANRAGDFERVSSRLTELELERGDSRAAASRLEVARGLPHLGIDERVGELAARLIGPGAIPTRAADDAVHLAVCATHAVPYLLTWNFRHLANASIRLKLEYLCASAGYRLPQICTPEEL